MTDGTVDDRQLSFLDSMDKSRFIQLLKLRTDQRISAAEQEELNAYLETATDNTVVVESFTEMMMEQVPDQEYDEFRFHPMINRAINVDKQSVPLITTRPAHRLYFLRRWNWAAAILLVLLGAGAIFYFRSAGTSTDQPTASTDPTSSRDVAPGGNKAVLTLADGTTIVLDSAANGTLAEQGNSKVIKLANGQIVYDAKGSVTAAAPVINKMSTPKGGQYQLTLPDGTRVWLNAASSITYPAAFTGVQRNVVVTGEAYFEVAKDRLKPFVVDVNDKLNVQVLGTHFNVNGYEDEGNTNTTLIEGRVKVNAQEKEATLLPGQQAQTSNNRLLVKDKADLEKVLAWKNGLFNFNDADLRSIMLQLSRWYDIEIVFEGAPPDRKFKGKMDRNLTLIQVLKILKETGIQYKLEGKKLTISQ